MRQEESCLSDRTRDSSNQVHAFADLHIHTSASDGRLRPAEVVTLATQEGFAAISICDHDTVAGLPEGFAAAEKVGLELIPGVELSTYLGSSEVHVLGYCLDYEDTSLVSVLEELCRGRVKRMEEMISRLRAVGVVLDRSKIDEAAAYGSVGRLHIARVLVEQGLVGDTREAFDKYIGRGKPAYVPRVRITPGQACTIIKKARGIPVLAHPSLIDGDKLMPRLMREGIMGIEAFYSKVSSEVAEHYCRLARKLGLIITGGSDCHQNETGGLLLGTVKLDYAHVEKLKGLARTLFGCGGE